MNFKSKEKLYRAVLPPEDRELFWENGKVSSAAFKDPKGLSVDRQNNRNNIDCIEYLKESKRGPIVSIQVKHCNEVDALVLSKPTENPHHCEIHGSETKKVLSKKQAKYLASMAKKESN